MTTNNHYFLKKRDSRSKKLFPVILFIIIYLSCTIFLSYKFCTEYFRYDTYINGMGCSFLTSDEALKRINSDIGKTTITYLFDDKTEQTTYSTYGIKLKNTDELDQWLKEQYKHPKSLNYTLSNLYVNEKKLKEHLLTFPNFKEISNNNILFKKEYEYVLTSLKSGCTTIDFRETTNTMS